MAIISQVRKEAKEHHNRITICINTEEIVHDVVAGGSTGCSAVSVTDKKPEPTGNDDIVDNGNTISVKASPMAN